MPRTRSRTRRVVIVVVVLLGLLGAGAYALTVFVDHQISKSVEWLADPFEALPSRPPAVTPTPKPDEAPTEELPVNILLMGSDSRISAGDPTQWQAGAQRTDSILLVNIPANRGRIFVMSIPRDSWVSIPGHGDAKINAAFSYGGPTLMIQTVEQLTGVRIDHFAVTDFESFSRLTDFFGGVEITIPDTTYDRRRRETIPAGTYNMDGAAALDYVRQRYGLPGGDFDRVQRQQNWMRAIATTAIDQGVRDDPIKLTRALEVMTRSMSVDENFTIDEMRRLALSSRPITESRHLVFFTAPVLGTGWSPDGRQSIVRLDGTRLARITEAIQSDTLWRFLDVHPGYLETLGETVQ